MFIPRRRIKGVLTGFKDLISRRSTEKIIGMRIATAPPTRNALFSGLFPAEPAYRLRQAEAVCFQPGMRQWSDATSLPKAMRAAISGKIPWMSCEEYAVRTNAAKDTFKAALKAGDGLMFETVLMRNSREQWTICVSSQIGCAMRCSFCATGAMGLKRSLSSDEIVDQYRFWADYILRQKMPGRISNVVFMGMGEPLANYDSVKEAIKTLLSHTDLGPTRITVSSVGVLLSLERILSDKDWPPVRIAISLHSANQKRREEIIPSTVPDFLGKLADWAQRYASLLGNRRHHVTYEYTLLSGVNDSEETARELARFIAKTGFGKINVIPYNPVKGKTFSPSVQTRIDRFKKIIAGFGIDVTQRRSMGDDIAAACGQLALDIEKKPHASPK